MITQPPTSCPMAEAQNELPALSKLTASGLISIGFCLLAMLFLVWNRFQVSPAAFSLLAFGVGGVIMVGKPWAPVLGTLYCLLFLLTTWYWLDGPEEAETTASLHLHLLLSPIILITFLTGIGATCQNYFSRKSIRQSPPRVMRRIANPA